MPWITVTHHYEEGTNTTKYPKRTRINFDHIVKVVEFPGAIVHVQTVQETLQLRGEDAENFMFHYEAMLMGEK